MEGGHGHGAKSAHSFAESAEEADLQGLANLEEYSEIFNGLTEHHTINTGIMDLVNIVISY